MPISDNVHPAAIAPYAGQITRYGLKEVSVGQLVSASADAEFGTGLVFVDREQRTVRIPNVTGGTFAGVVQMPLGSIAVSDGEVGAYTPAESPDVSLINQAPGIAVKVNGAVTAGNDVFLVFGTGSDAGYFRNDATSAVQVPGAKFITTTAGAGIAEIVLVKEAA